MTPKHGPGLTEGWYNYPNMSLVTFSQVSCLRRRLCGVCCLAGLFKPAFITPPFINQCRQSCWGRRELDSVPQSTLIWLQLLVCLRDPSIFAETRGPIKLQLGGKESKNKTNKRFTFNANKAGEILILVPCACSMWLIFCRPSRVSLAMLSPFNAAVNLKLNSHHKTQFEQYRLHWGVHERVNIAQKSLQ